MSSDFAEADIAARYDETFSALLELWHGRPVQHAGYFMAEDADDYRAAAARLSQLLVTDAAIHSAARVLDVGCGCGEFVIGLAEQLGCRAVGLDLSPTQVEFARMQLAAHAALPASFDLGSASELPYPDVSFTHVVSQDALYHVPDKPRSHAELFRVLTPGGMLAVTDFLEPRKEVSERARPHLYDRMMRGHGYSLVDYQVALCAAGFEILLARNLDHHIKRSYLLLARLARSRARETVDPARRRALHAYLASCLEVRAAVARGEFGWGMIVARRPASPTTESNPSAALLAALSGTQA